MAYDSIAKTYLSLTEALQAPSHKTMATKASNSTMKDGMTEAQRISNHVFPEGQDRLVIPFERTMEPNSDVKKHLEDNGYKIHDYAAGLAVKNGQEDRPLRIGRVLTRINAPDHIWNAFDKDPARQGIKMEKGPSIVISRHPHDVAAMSSGQNWQSCQTLPQTITKKKSDGTSEKVKQEKGLHAQMVPGIVSSGAHIAYLVNDPKDVDKHFGPIARITLNPFVSHNDQHTILRPSEEYGDEWAGFKDTLTRWTEKNFPTKEAKYYRHSGAYPEGTSQITDYSPKHDEYWKDEYFDKHALINHPSPAVHEHWLNLFNRAGNTYNSNAVQLMTNPHLNKENSDKIFNNIYNDKQSISKIAQIGNHHDQLEKIMEHPAFDKSMAVSLAGNENTSSDQLHRVMDKFGFDGSSHASRILTNVARNSNSNDTHFHKILDSKELSNKNHPDYSSDYMDMESGLENIASRYNSESVGRKLLSKFPTSDWPTAHGIVHHVALKHPHLMDAVDPKLVAKTVLYHTMNKNLQNYALNSNHKDLIKAGIKSVDYTQDESVLDKFANHHDPEIRETVARQKVLNQHYREAQEDANRVL